MRISGNMPKGRRGKMPEITRKHDTNTVSHETHKWLRTRNTIRTPIVTNMSRNVKMILYTKHCVWQVAMATSKMP